MKSKFFAPALALFCSTIFVSCNKDEDKSTTELLTQSGWKAVSVQADLGTGTYVNVPIEACAKDDMIKFNSDHSYKFTTGTKCDPTDPDEVDNTGAWSLSADEKTISIDDENATIETLNSNTLITVSSETLGGMTHRTRVTFGH